MNDAIHYQITVEPSSHRFKITLHIADPDADGQILALPAWVPGSYMVRDLARHVVEIRAHQQGAPVTLRKIAKNRWRVDAVSGPLQVEYTIFAFDRSVRTAFLDDQGGFFNGPAVLLRVVGQEDRSHSLTLNGPEPWQVSTAMPRTSGTTWGWGTFSEGHYRAFIDHPVLMGTLTLLNFEAGRRPHHLLIQGHHSANLQRLGKDLARICDWQQQFWGDAAFSEYHFLCMTSSDQYGGLEHRASSALICARDDLSGRNEDHYQRFLGLASHEYFHSWLVQAIRPAVFSASDLDDAVLSRDLWVFEGITSYYDDLCLRRAGLITPEQYLKGMGQELTRLLRRPGRLLQSLAESSEDAWIKLYHSHTNSANFEISYYNKGALLALCLDLTLRLESDGALSLDHVLARLWQDYGRSGKALPEGDCVTLVGDMTNRATAERLHTWIMEKADLPLEPLLAQMGIQLHRRAATDLKDMGGEPASQCPDAWIGAQWRVHDLGLELRYVQADGPVEQAGLSTGDIMVAIEGLRATQAQFTQQIAAAIPGVRLRIQYFRDDIFCETHIVPVAAPQDTVWLELLTDVDDVVRARREAWLGDTLHTGTKR